MNKECDEHDEDDEENRNLVFVMKSTTMMATLLR